MPSAPGADTDSRKGAPADSGRARDAGSAPHDRAQLRALAEATGDVAWEFDAATGRLWRSATWFTMLGHPEECESPTLETWLGLVHPDDRARVAREFQERVNGDDVRWATEYRLARADGSYARVMSRSYATRRVDGRVLRVIGTITDITEWRRTEERLRERERQLAEAQELAGIGSWELHFDTNAMTWSPELYRIYGVDADYDTTFHHALADLVPPEDQPAVAAAVAEIMGTGHPVEATWRVVRPCDGRTRYIWGRGCTVRDASGKPTRAVGVIQDITEQEARRKELNDARRAAAAQERLSTLGTMLAGVAHEINNPLSYVQGHSELCGMALDDLLAAEGLPRALENELREVRGQVDKVLKGVHQIAHVTSSLKHVARSGGTSPRLDTDLNEVVQSALTLATTRLPLEIEVRSRLGLQRRVHGNPSEIAQVVLNLVLNAGDALRGRAGAELTVRTFEDHGRAVVEVEDNGPGIPAEAQARIFTPFFTTKTDGTGLGLSVSQRLMAEHEGTLTFRSTEGTGTVFRVELPLRGRARAGP